MHNWNVNTLALLTPLLYISHGFSIFWSLFVTVFVQNMAKSISVQITLTQKV